MNTESRLQVLFNKYNTSPKATKNFINFFMKNAELFISRNNLDSSDSEFEISEIHSHEGNKYKFLLRDHDLHGKRAVFEHQPDENFNFYIKAVSEFNGDILNDNWTITISRNEDGTVALRATYHNEAFISYDASASRWSNDVLNHYFPEGLPPEVGPEIKDFEPLLINRDFSELHDGIADTYYGNVVNHYFTFSGDSFNYEDIPENTTIELTQTSLSYGDISGGTCIVNGTLSNAETGASVNLEDRILKIHYEDGAAYLILKSVNDKLYDTVNLQVTVPYPNNEIYGAVMPKYSALATSGYNIMIPLCNKKNLVKSDITELYSTGNDPHSLLRFVSSNFYNENDHLRLEFERSDQIEHAHFTYANGNKCDLKIAALQSLAAGNNYKVKLQYIDTDLVVTVHDRNGNLLATDTISGAGSTIYAGALNALEHVNQYVVFSNANEGATSEAFIKKSVYTDNVFEALLRCYSACVMIKLYINDELYAQSYGGQLFYTINPDADTDDELWMCTMTFTRMNSVPKNPANWASETAGNIKLNLIGREGYTGLRLHCATNNYRASIGYMLVDLGHNQKLVYNFIPSEKGLIMMDEKCIPRIDYLPKEKTLSGISLFKARTLGLLRYKECSKDFDLKANLKIIPSKEDAFPYLISGTNIALDKPVGNVSYSHRTQTFTINNTINAYYKIGFCALDGLDESSKELANSFIEKAGLVVSHKSKYSYSPSSGDYCFYIKPSSNNSEDNYFYGVSDTAIHYDLSTPIIMSLTNGYEYICHVCCSILLPILKISRDLQTSEPVGVIYMQLFNADTNEEINTSIRDTTSSRITLDGEDAMDKSIAIVQIND